MRRDTQPDVILRDGKPVAVVLDIEEYREMLEQIEDLDDMERLVERMPQNCWLTGNLAS